MDFYWRLQVVYQRAIYGLVVRLRGDCWIHSFPELVAKARFFDKGVQWSKRH